MNLNACSSLVELHDIFPLGKASSNILFLKKTTVHLLAGAPRGYNVKTELVTHLAVRTLDCELKADTRGMG